MDSYVVRIYRRGGRKSRILIGTAEVAGAGRKMALFNIDELWEILGHQKGRDLCAPPSPPCRLGKEVMSDSSARHRGIRGGSPSNQTHFRTLKGGKSDEKTLRNYGSHAPAPPPCSSWSYALRVPRKPRKGRGAVSTTTGPPTGTCLAANGVAEVSAEGTGVASPWGASTWVGDKTC